MGSKIWLPLALALTLFLSPKILIAGSGPSSPIVTELSAQMAAEKAFLQETNHEVAKYSIRPIQHTEARWRFLIEGKKEFARPGYH